MPETLIRAHHARLALRPETDLFEFTTSRGSIVKAFLVMVLLSIGLIGCSTRQMLNTVTPSSGYSVANNVTYDIAHNLKLDVYTPDTAQNAPVVIFYHGGRWQHGDKSDDRFVGQALAAMGFVAVVPNTRLYPPAHYKDFLHDSAQAVAWTRKFAKSYGGNPDQIVLMGFSSGAYNAMMLALDPAWLKAVGGSADWIKGAIGISGPYDILPITAPDLRAIFGPASQFQKTQPVFWANGDNPPLLLIASRADRIVKVKNTTELFDRVKRAQGPVEKVIYQNLDHLDTLADLSSSLLDKADISRNVAAFIHRVTDAKASDN